MKFIHDVFFTKISKNILSEVCSKVVLLRTIFHFVDIKPNQIEAMLINQGKVITEQQSDSFFFANKAIFIYIHIYYNFEGLFNSET